MICSMTGFGQAEISRDGNKVSVELSSLNNRYFETQIRIPKRFSHLEANIKELINAQVKRGKVICAVKWESELIPALRLQLNEQVVEMYAKMFDKLKEKLSMPGNVTISDFITLDGVFEPIGEEDTESNAELLREAVASALEDLQAMRLKEGERLATDIRPRIAKIAEATQRISASSHESMKLYRKKLEARIHELLDELTDQGERITIEAAVVAERCDVTEECVRIESHNLQFLETLDETGPVGKRLNFILQELNREANTIGSKSISTAVSRDVILLKEEIEKLREQVQNIE